MTPGIYKDIDIQDYHGDKSWISTSALKKAKRSLHEFWYYQNGYFDFERKWHFDFGNSFELALLDPMEFDEKVSNETDIYNDILEAKPKTKSFRSTTMYKEWLKEQGGKYILPSTGKESWETIKLMLESSAKDAVIGKLLSNIEIQNSIYWRDPKTGLQLKTRPDVCMSKKNVIVDIKTTIDGSPEKFSKDLANHDYPLQAIQQIEGVLKSGLMPSVDAYFWLVYEKNPPYNATLYRFAPEDQLFVHDEWRYLIDRVSQAIKKDFWPGYTDRVDNKHGILTARIPSWYGNYQT